MTVPGFAKARQLASTYWLYVVWDPTELDAKPVIVKNLVDRLEYAARAHPTLGRCELAAIAVLREAEP